MNITGVVGVQCGLFYIPNNFNVKVRLLGQMKQVFRVKKHVGPNGAPQTRTTC